MKKFRPHGSAPTNWEADILKIRAFEMVLVLFYVEHLKQFILSSIRFTDKIRKANRLGDGTPKREGKLLELARQVLVTEGVITQTESDELHELVDYRNIIGHNVHEMTVDIGAHSDLTKLDPKTFKPIPAYDYTAAKRAKQLSEKISKGMMANFIMSLSFDDLQFETAEKVYLAEINRLKKRVNKCIAQTNKLIADTNKIIKGIPKRVMDAAQPSHPRNIKGNGTLSKHGVSCVFQLYEAKATPLAVAYLMRISYRAAMSWFKRWKSSKA